MTGLLTSLRLRAVDWLTGWITDPYDVAGDADIAEGELAALRRALTDPANAGHFAEPAPGTPPTALDGLDCIPYWMPRQRDGGGS